MKVAATPSTLTLPGVQIADEGTYAVVVTDDFGSETSQPAVLDVIAPITFVMRPQSQSVAVGDDVTFTVEISGGPPPFRYTWRKNITQVLSSEVRSERTASFTITNVQLSDAGNYLVHVTNSISAVSSLPAAVLTVTNAAAASR